MEEPVTTQLPLSTLELYLQRALVDELEEQPGQSSPNFAVLSDTVDKAFAGVGSARPGIGIGAAPRRARAWLGGRRADRRGRPRALCSQGPAPAGRGREAAPCLCRRPRCREPAGLPRDVATAGASGKRPGTSPPMSSIRPSSTEPALDTPAHLLPILDELRSREPIFHSPAFGATRAERERATAGDFWEIGASGQRYSRAYVLDLLDRRAPDPDEHTWQTGGFHCRELGPDTYLLTYTLAQGRRVSRRSTIWRRRGDDWQVLFHQGTLVAD